MIRLNCLRIIAGYFQDFKYILYFFQWTKKLNVRKVGHRLEIKMYIFMNCLSFGEVQLELNHFKYTQSDFQKNERL